MSSSPKRRLADTIGAPDAPEHSASANAGLDQPGKLVIHLMVTGDGASGGAFAANLTAEQLLEPGVGDRALRSAIENWQRNAPPRKVAGTA